MKLTEDLRQSEASIRAGKILVVAYTAAFVLVVLISILKAD